MERHFMKMLRHKWSEGKYLCIGLDTYYEKIPNNIPTAGASIKRMEMFEFNKRIIDTTKDIVCAYKPNLAFYGQYGQAGLGLLEDTIKYIKKFAPDIIVILDVKIGDIGDTNIAYAKYVFDNDNLGADAITVHSYTGSEAMKPFLDRKDKGIIALCCTSNKGAGQMQDMKVIGHSGEMPYYQSVAETVDREWNTNGNCLLVVGATYPEKMKEIRAITQMPFLVPAIGKQGGDLQKVIEGGLDNNGEGLIISASSSIIFAPDPRAEALKLNTQIIEARKNVLQMS